MLRIAGVEPRDVGRVTFPFVDYLSAHPVITRLLLQPEGFPVDPENPIDVARAAQIGGQKSPGRAT